MIGSISWGVRHCSKCDPENRTIHEVDLIDGSDLELIELSMSSQAGDRMKLEVGLLEDHILISGHSIHIESIDVNGISTIQEGRTLRDCDRTLC